MTTIPTIKECVKGTARFTHYRAGNLWYEAENGFSFPVPIEDIGDATFNESEKGMLLMRYIRKHIDVLNSAKDGIDE